MSFPFEVEETTVTIQYAATPKEYEIDFITGQLTGKIVEGLEAIKIWVYLALNTSRYRHVIYSWDYGNEIEDLIGHSFTKNYLDTEVPRMLEDCLLGNPYIKSVENVNVTLNNDEFSGSFTINTDYGEVETNV